MQFGLIISFMYTVYLAYQISQYKKYNKESIQKINQLLDLEITNNVLRKKQKDLIEQTTQLIQSSKLAALADMAGGLSHEINNSLMVILGSAQHLERELNLTLNIPKVYKKIEVIRGASFKIKSVIEGLKFFSMQLESPAKVITSLDTIIEHSLPYYSELLKAHDIELEISQIPSVNIKCQIFQTIQVIFNLIKNADEAICSGTQVEKKWIKIEFFMEEKFILIKIKNSGSRISLNISNRLFEPFFSTKDINKGTGLSLSISKGIAMDHNGDLYLDISEPVTTFILKLPVAI